MLHISHTKTHARKIKRGPCPDCKRESFFAWFYEDWYGTAETCLRCGRHWIDNCWMPLEFSRTARQENINAAKARWRRGLTPNRPNGQGE